jgi:hypothetical protein
VLGLFHLVLGAVTRPVMTRVSISYGVLGLFHLENTNNAGFAEFRIRNGDSNTVELGITGSTYAGGGPSASSMFLYTGMSGLFQLFTNGTERMRIDTSGNFNLGAGAPGDKLDITGVNTSNTGIRVTGSVGSNNGNRILVQNTNTAGYSYIRTDNNGDTFDFVKTGSSYSGGGPTAGAGALYLSGNNPIEFFTNASERMRIFGAGGVGVNTTTINSDSQLEVAGHITTEGTAPTVSACGTSPAIVGSDTAGKVTIGTGVTTSCTLTFATAYANAPPCVVTGDQTATTYAATTSTTALIITSSADMDSDVIMYICVGRG